MDEWDGPFGIPGRHEPRRDIACVGRPVRKTGARLTGFQFACGRRLNLIFLVAGSGRREVRKEEETRRTNWATRDHPKKMRVVCLVYSFIVTIWATNVFCSSLSGLNGALLSTAPFGSNLRLCLPPDHMQVMSDHF